MRHLKLASLIIGMTVLTVAYHNCAPSASDGGAASSVTPPGVIPICPYTTNPAPSIQGIFSDTALSVSAASVTYKVGMGADAGTDPTKNLYVKANANDSYSQIIDVKCDAGNSGLTATCGLNNGNLRIQLNPAQGSECLSGNFSISVKVTDSVTAPGCANLSATSGPATFNVNIVNGCLPTYRENPSTPYKAGQLGANVATSGTWAVASSPGDSQAGAQAGAAYFYSFDGSTWSLFKKVIPSTIAAGSSLASVAISGTTAVVGAALDNVGTGKAWVFQFNGTDWVEAKQLMSPTPTMGELFGAAVAVSNGIVTVSAPRNSSNGFQSGIVYAFSGSGFTAVQSISPFIDPNVAGDTLITSGFGTSLSFVGDTLAVGAPFPNASATRMEAVYVFHSGAGFAGGQKIVNADGNGTKRFGQSVAVSGNSLLVGAPFYNSNNLTEVGRAYMYARASTAVNFGAASTMNFNAADPGNVDHFGYSVALDATNILIAAPDKTFDQLAKVGAVYRFNNQGTQVFKIREYKADRYNDSFGVSISTVNGWLFSGAFNADEVLLDPNYLDVGATYFVQLP